MRILNNYDILFNSCTINHNKVIIILQYFYDERFKRMAKGIFNRLYYGKSNKPDLLEEDMAQNKFSLFFEIIGVRFWQFVKVNLLYFLFMIPAVLWIVINFLTYLNAFSASADFDVSGLFITFLVGMIPCSIVTGIGMAGMSYIMRRAAWDKHVWIMSDFTDAIKENWKQAIALSLLISVGAFVLVWIGDLYTQLALGGNSIYIVVQYFLYFIGILFLISLTLYGFPMMVSYKLSFKELIKNSILIGLGKLHFTILFSILAIIPLLLLFMLMYFWEFGYLVLFLYYIVFGFSFVFYTNAAFTNNTFQKIMKINVDANEKELGED